MTIPTGGIPPLQGWEDVNYGLVGRLEVVEPDADGQPTVTARERVATYRPTLAHGETWRRVQTIPHELSGDRVRLVYLLYEGTIPETPTGATAVHETHLWVNGSAA